jgi:proline racemase
LKFSKAFFTIDTHTAGHPERIITSGLPSIPGKTMMEKRDYIRKKLDFVRKILTHEPRGHSSMHCAYITDPANPEADMGVIFIGAIHYGEMCGHGTIATVTGLIETGIIPSEEGENVVKLDIPGMGLVKTVARVEKGKVKNVTFRNTPCFLYEKDVRVEVPSIGTVTGDVGYGGNWYFYVQAKDLGVHVRLEEIISLLMRGSQLKEAVNEQIEVKHPVLPDVSSEFLGVIINENSDREDVDERNVLVVGPRHFDRSPCGTGTSGKVAIWYAKGKLKKGESLVNESILGTAFVGKVAEEVGIGSYTGVIPEITGSAYITGFHQFVVDPDDPLGGGFYV